VTEQRTARSRPWPAIAVVVALAAATALTLFLSRERQPPLETWDRPLEPVAQVRSVNGSAWARRGEVRRGLAAEGTLYVGEGLEVEGSLSLVTYPAGATLGLGNGRLFFESPAELRLEVGRVQADIGTAATVLVTPHAKITGLGTRVAVEVAPRGTQIEVQRGDALVEGPDVKQRVRTGAHLFLAARPATAVER
jgi:hypothetical protein